LNVFSVKSKETGKLPGWGGVAGVSGLAGLPGKAFWRQPGCRGDGLLFLSSTLTALTELTRTDGERKSRALKLDRMSANPVMILFSGVEAPLPGARRHPE
jgi:hypothetical protein